MTENTQTKNDTQPVVIPQPDTGLWSQIEETLINWQLPYESELFSLINVKRKFEKLEKEEQKYFGYYKNTFQLELLSALVTVPMGYFVYKYKQETSKSVKDAAMINKRLKILFLWGIPAINLFLVAFYRRYFYKHPQEDVLRLKYFKEIRELQKSKPKS